MSAGAIRAGKAFVEVGADTNPLIKGLKRASRAVNAYSANVAQLGAKMLGAGAALLAPVYLAISAGSDLEETMNKFNVVFDKNAAAVKAWGDEYGATVGRSQRQIADFMASNQDLLVPMGFEPGAAEKMSKDITKLSVDLASFNNKADADVLNDLQAALTGSGEVMKKYGVIVSQAAVNQELLNMKMDPKKATEAQKAQARWNIIVRGTTAAQGDAVRSANSWANQKKALAATIENVAGAIGSQLLPVVTPLLSQFRNGVEIIGGFIAENAGLVFAVTGLGAALLAAGGLAIGLAVALKVAAVAVGVLASVAGLVLSPLGLITAGLAALIYYSGAGSAALAWLSERFGDLATFAQETFGTIKKAMNAGEYGLAAKTLWAAIKVAWYEGTQGISAILADWKGYFNDTWQDTIRGAARFFINEWANLQTVWAKITQFFGDAWDIVVGGIVDAWKSAQNTIADYALDVIATVDPTIDKEAARAELYSMQAQEKENRTSAQNKRIVDREAETRKEINAIAENQAGANSVLDEEAQKQAAAREERLKKARQAAKDATEEARGELRKLTAEVNALPDPENTNLAQNANKNKGFGDTPTAQAALSSKNIQTGGGLDALVSLINAAGRDMTLEEAKKTNVFLAELVDLYQANKPKILKANA